MQKLEPKMKALKEICENMALVNEMKMAKSYQVCVSKIILPLGVQCFNTKTYIGEAL